MLTCDIFTCNMAISKQLQHETVMYHIADMN